MSVYGIQHLLAMQQERWTVERLFWARQVFVLSYSTLCSISFITIWSCTIDIWYAVEYGTEKGRCKWWRLSFSAIEKRIVKHADGTCSQDKGKTCRKDVLRLLKDDLAEFYEKNQHFKDKKICSYFMKTVVLGLWEEQSWADRDLLPRYVNALERTVKCLSDRNIKHFFIDGENLLNEKEISDSELSAVKKYFHDVLKCYSI